MQYVFSAKGNVSVDIKNLRYTIVTVYNITKGRN